jgi:MoaA/NifB/PqqE/SkfB family radical SAM enzyme
MRQLDERGFSEDDLIKALNMINGSVHLYLTGGEPLLSSELQSTIKKIKVLAPHVEVGLFTCGVINTSSNLQPMNLETTKSLKDSGLTDCYLSLYHVEKSVHDFITNQPFSFDCTMETISNLMSVGIEAKIHLVVNKYNVQSLEHIIREISEIGVKEIRILRLVHGGNAIENWSEIGVSYATQNEAILEIINKINDFDTKITVSGFPEDFPCRPFENSIKCQAGINVLYITYSGDVYPCACTKNQGQCLIGNISEPDKIGKFLVDNKSRIFNEHCLNTVKNM